MNKEEPWPVGRNNHAAVCLWNGPQLLVTGGLDENMKVIDDTWILNFQTGRWREVIPHSSHYCILRDNNIYNLQTSVPIQLLCVSFKFRVGLAKLCKHSNFNLAGQYSRSGKVLSQRYFILSFSRYNGGHFIWWMP